ncbi:MAG: GHKL domain-containing protein, partial [Spirochaetes bacterium]|nr:GHKL domain-containing protein [Spirochaetota bacterium]
IKQVFINIITNAIQAIPARGKINIKAEKIKHRVRIKIHDTGCGMDEKTMKHMFEPLYSSKTKGIGLGMAIVFDIIKSHDGTIQVESKVNKGTTVSIFLPLK